MANTNTSDPPLIFEITCDIDGDKKINFNGGMLASLKELGPSTVFLADFSERALQAINLNKNLMTASGSNGNPPLRWKKVGCSPIHNSSYFVLLMLEVNASYLNNLPGTLYRMMTDPTYQKTIEVGIFGFPAKVKAINPLPGPRRDPSLPWGPLLLSGDPIIRKGRILPYTETLHLNRK